MSPSLLISIIVAVIHSPYTVSSECVSQRPSSCAVGIPSEEQLKASFHATIATPNLTLYTGQTAVFTYQIDTTLDGGLSPVAFVDGCLDEVHCKLTTPLERTCTFTNITASDNGKQIYFYVLASLWIIPGQLCHDPPSYITVLGPPSSIDISYSISSSSGLYIYLTSSLPPDTNATISLHTDSSLTILSAVILTGNHGNDNITLFSPSILHNHTGIYTVRCIPINPAGDGPPTTVTVDLYNEGDYSLHFSLTKAKVNHTSSSKFMGILDIQVDLSHPLTIPNIFHVSSSCSGGLAVKHTVNMTHLLEVPVVSITVPLVHGGRDCSFNVVDELGGEQIVDTNQSTFYTISYTIKQHEDSFDISCQFTEGSTVDGCWVAVKDAHSNTSDDKLIPILNGTTSTVVPMGPYLPGNYTILIYDQVNGTHDETNPTFSYQFKVLPKVAPSPTTSSIATSDSSCALGSGCLGPTVKSRNNFGMIPSIVVIAVVVIIIATIIVVVVFSIVIFKQRRNSGRYAVGVNHDNPPVDDDEDKNIGERDPVKEPHQPLQEPPSSPSTNEESRLMSPLKGGLYEVVPNTATEDNKESNSDTQYTSVNIVRPQAEVPRDDNAHSFVVAGNDLRNIRRPNELKGLVTGNTTNRHNLLVKTSETTFDSTKEDEEIHGPLFTAATPVPSPTTLEPPPFPSYSRQGSNASTIVPTDEYPELTKRSVLGGNVMVYPRSRKSSVTSLPPVRNDSIATLEDTMSADQRLQLVMPSHHSSPLFKENDESDYMTEGQSKTIQDASRADGSLSTMVGHGHSIDTTNTTTGGTDSSLKSETDRLISRSKK